MSPSWPANPDGKTAFRLAPVSRPVWDGFLFQWETALPYHTWEWLDFLSSVYGNTWHPLGIWKGACLVGLFPVMTRRLGPFRLAGSPLMQAIANTPFLGPVAPLEHFQEISLALEAFFHTQRVAHTEISFPTRLSEADVAWAEDRGYLSETCEAVFLSLHNQPPQQLWMGLSNACRRAIRKAQANGVEIMVIKDDRFIETYAAMCQEVYRGSGRLSHLSETFYRKLWGILAESDLVHGLLATYRGQIIAGAIFLLYHQYASYLSGASFDQWQFLRPNNLLQWHFIEWAASHGYKTYDLGGTTIPGITRFKLSFGGQLIAYTRLHRANSSLARIGRQVYQATIPVWRRFQSRIETGKEGTRFQHHTVNTLKES